MSVPLVIVEFNDKITKCIIHIKLYLDFFKGVFIVIISQCQ